MNWIHTLRAELRKLTGTRMPIAFFVVLIVIGAATATAVAFGTDMDGSKTFISTAADQQSLVAFAANAFLIGGLFGSIAVAREYSYGTIVHTFLATPHRVPAVLAQQAAALVAGAFLGLAGALVSITSVALALTATDYGFMVPMADVAQVIGATTFAGAAGAVLGSGLGALIRNVGGAVTGTIVLLLIVPPILVQMANEVGSWVPGTLATTLSGVDSSVSLGAAVLAMAAWAAVPVMAGIGAVLRRDVV